MGEGKCSECREGNREVRKKTVNKEITGVEETERRKKRRREE